MDGDAPIELLGYHGELDVILARRVGEPSFIWVQDIGDAFQAADSRGVDVVVSQDFLAELTANGDLPPELPPGLRIR